MEAKRIAEALIKYEEEFTFLRDVTFSVEEHWKIFRRPAPPYGYRWFKSENVVDLSKVRRLKALGRL